MREKSDPRQYRGDTGIQVRSAAPRDRTTRPNLLPLTAMTSKLVILFLDDGDDGDGDSDGRDDGDGGGGGDDDGMATGGSALWHISRNGGDGITSSQSAAAASVPPSPRDGAVQLRSCARSPPPPAPSTLGDSHSTTGFHPSKSLWSSQPASHSAAASVPSAHVGAGPPTKRARSSSPPAPPLASRGRGGSGRGRGDDFAPFICAPPPPPTPRTAVRARAASQALRFEVSINEMKARIAEKELSKEERLKEARARLNQRNLPTEPPRATEPPPPHRRAAEPPPRPAAEVAPGIAAAAGRRHDQAEDADDGGCWETSIDGARTARRFPTPPPPRPPSGPRFELATTRVGAVDAAAFLFMCNRATESEVLQRRLFGLPSAQLGIMRAFVSALPSAPLLLYNMDTREVRGPFAADGEPARDLVPEAWRGRFKAQLRFVGASADLSSERRATLSSGLRRREGALSAAGGEQLLRKLGVPCWPLPTAARTDDGATTATTTAAGSDTGATDGGANADEERRPPPKRRRAATATANAPPNRRRAAERAGAQAPVCVVFEW